MVASLFTSSSSTSLPSLPSSSSHSKKSTYIPRYDSTTSPISPSSPSSNNNTQHTSPLPTASKNSRTRSSHNNQNVILPPPLVSFATTTTPSSSESPATSSTGSSSRSHSGKSSPSFHSMASLTPSMASSSYTQKMARREKRHFQSSPSSTYSSSSSSSTSGKSPRQNSKKGGVKFSPSQPLFFLNRSAPVTSSSAIVQPASTAKPKDRFLSRSSLPFTALSSSSSPSSASTAKSPLAAGTSAPITQPAPKIATTNSSRVLRASLRNRISTWASSVRQSFTAAHSQDHHSSNSTSLPAPISPSTPTMRVNPDPLFPLPSESHSALPQSSPSQEVTTPKPTPTTPPILLLSSKEDLADMTTTSSSSSSSSKEAIEGGTRTNLATTGKGVTLLPLLPLVQETDKPAAIEDEDKLTHRHHSHLYPSALPYSTPSRPTPPKLHVQTTLTPKYPTPVATATAGRSIAQYTPLSASGRSKPRNPFATTPTALAPVPAAAAAAAGVVATPTPAATTIKAQRYTFQSSLERARFLNAARSRKVGSGLITVFCIAAIVILILC